ncbi:hypothetical protein BY996DRAFT_7014046 [Phakopsora pachyrhizi]|uniref:Expressed protein n=1 Tax=Phakopsora pachyrhizi TaxID=170000 RepID=A0AAV0BKA3_PHAPC|nr:hypothetical protein BY996DRAFT_7014046 [Phakopsora pachyrhizi]CAH7686749.1 expressed protein [Phakopsora pachyrhizi]
MIFRLPKILPCLALWTKCIKGSEKAIDFIASFSDQTKTSSRASDIFEPNAQTETLEKNWLSLGRSNSCEGSDERIKKSTEINELSLGVVGTSNYIGTNQVFKQPLYQIQQQNRNNVYNPELLSRHSPHEPSFVNLFKPLSTIYASKNKVHVTEIELQHLTPKNKERDFISDPSKMGFKRMKNNNGQIVKDESSKEILDQKERKYPDNQIIQVADLWNGAKTKKFIEPEQKVKFQNILMALLQPESSMINLDFVQGCIESIHQLKNDMRDSMLDNLACIKGQIMKHGGAEFYITDSEVKDFSTKPSGISFKIKSDSKSKSKSKKIHHRFLRNFKEMVEPMNFENLINQFIKVDVLKSSVSLKPQLWQAYDEQNNLTLKSLRKKMYIGKVFLVYSIMINKIFYNGPKNDGFIRQQRAAIEFYQLVCEAAETDERGNFSLQSNILRQLAKSPEETLNLKILEFNFNHNLKYRKNQSPNWERILFVNAMILIEIWLINYRPELYKNTKFLNNNSNIFLKPFMNSIFEILLQISVQKP